MNRRLALVIRVVAIVAVAAALWWFVRAMDFAAFGRALRDAKVWPLVVAAGINFVCLLGKATCWRIMLAPRHIVPVRRLYRYTIAAFAASAIAPARAGELLRLWTLKKRHGVPGADSAAVAVTEKLLDAMAMLILAALVPWLLPGLPSWVAFAIAGCSAVALLALAVLMIVVRRMDLANPTSVFRRFLAGMHVLRSPRRVLGVLGVLVTVWLADLCAVMSVLYAVGIDLPVAGGILILFTVNLTIVVPSTPGQIGAHEIGALAALNILEVPREPALAFALLYHMLQVIPLIIAGLTLELRMVVGKERPPADGAPEAAGAAPKVE